MNTLSMRSKLLATVAAITIGLSLVAPALAQDAGEMAAPAVNISLNPTDMPGPITARSSQHHVVNLETTEVLGQLDDGTTYTYWTFNDHVPGPMIRVRVGDTVEVNLTNSEDSMMFHNVDFHAVTGPGGGGVATLAAPGETRSFRFTAMNPGVYVYHCATPMVAQHIANGMYGLIVVEPEEGMTPVDREFYVMQGEIYTEEDYGTQGHLTESIDKLLDEDPEYYVFNGAAEALRDNPLQAEVGDRVRIFFGVGGPNATSSFHVIGEIFDQMYAFGSLTTEPVADVQTTTVAPGGAVVVEFEVQVPGDYILVDHALSRAQRGLSGILHVTGPENHDIFQDLND